MQGALAHDWNDHDPSEGEELTELIAVKVGRLEENAKHLKEGQDRLEIKTDLLDTKLDFHAAETSKALQEIKEGIAVRNATAAERSRNLAVAGAALGTAATGICGLLYAYGAKIVAILFAALPRV